MAGQKKRRKIQDEMTLFLLLRLASLPQTLTDQVETVPQLTETEVDGWLVYIPRNIDEEI